ncbi:hypothetical protein [Nocardiopsis sp. NPDC058789]|uniref:hypothetical protein n=1 Tax=Nocardiopsis sp. NPDC058789 TaxID=3346634 RepID=UPI0036722E34
MVGQALVVQVIALVFQSAGAVSLILALLWNRRRGRFGWSERARARLAPGSAERRRVRPFLRDGTAAPDPELARLTVRVAEHRVRSLENPWQVPGTSLFAMGAGLFAFAQFHSAYGFGPLAWWGLALCALAVNGPLVRRIALDRARRALAANRELAEPHADSEEPPEHTGARER